MSLDNSSLARFDHDGIELIIDTKTGESFATQRGYARMSNKTQVAIFKRLEKLDNQTLIKNAEIDTGYGFKVVNLIPESIISEWLPEF